MVSIANCFWPAGCAVLDGLTCRLRCTCWSDLQAALYLLVSPALNVLVWPAGCAGLVGLTFRLRWTCWSDLRAVLYLLVWPAGCAVLVGLTCRLRCTWWSDLQAALYLFVWPAGCAVLVGLLHPDVDVVDVEEGKLPGHHPPHHQHQQHTPHSTLQHYDQQPATWTSLSLQKTNFRAVVSFVNTCVPDWILQHVRNLCVQTRDILLFICLVDFLQYFELGDRA